MNNIILFISLLLVCITCFNASSHNENYNRVFTMYIDSTFTPLEQSAIIKAGHLWQTATEGRVSFKFIEINQSFDAVDLLGNNNSNIILKADSNDSGLFFFELVNVGAPILGLAPPGRYIILVPNRIETNDELITVAAHELGHHISLRHTPSIMNPDSKNPCITEYDLLQFCQEYDCNFNTDTKATCSNGKPYIEKDLIEQ